MSAPEENAGPPNTVYLVDDDPDHRRATAQTLSLEGFEVEEFELGQALLDVIALTSEGVIVCDVKLPGKSGEQVFEECRDIDADLPVILISGHADIPMAVRSVKKGAFDFFEKPLEPEDLILAVRNAMNYRTAILENRRLTAEMEFQDTLEKRLLGQSAAMSKLRADIIRVAGFEADVLIQGETGSGKELVANAIHDLSARTGGPFIAVNCGALPENLVESELFGHEKGAFTGTANRHIGRFERAQGGTILLDEVESMPLKVQVRFLRVLQERVIERVGGEKEIPVDVRVIAATKTKLKGLVEDGSFREDLYYRLNVANLLIPALRNREADAYLLFRHYVKEEAERNGVEAPDIGAEMTARVLAHDWPGNVRELANAAECFVLGMPVLGNGADAASGVTATSGKLPDRVMAYEREIIAASLKSNGGSIKDTAEELGLPRKTLQDKMTKYALKRNEFLADFHPQS